jgi:hypothetical protein
MKILAPFCSTRELKAEPLLLPLLTYNASLRPNKWQLIYGKEKFEKKF